MPIIYSITLILLAQQIYNYQYNQAQNPLTPQLTEDQQNQVLNSRLQQRENIQSPVSKIICPSEVAKELENDQGFEAIGYSSCYIKHILQPTNQWSITVNQTGQNICDKLHNFQRIYFKQKIQPLFLVYYVCLGILPFPVYKAQKESPSDSYLLSSVSYCTDQKIFNFIDQSDIIVQGLEDEQENGQQMIFEITYFGKLLTIQQQDSTLWIQFKIDEQIEFIPFIEMNGGPENLSIVGNLQFNWESSYWRPIRTDFTYNLTGNEISRQLQNGQAFIDVIANSGDNWAAVVTKSEGREQFFCAGVIDVDTIYAIQESWEFNFMEISASSCSNGKQYNGIVQDQIVNFSSLERSRGQVIFVELEDSKLYVNNLANNYRAEFQLKKERNYVPYFLATENVKLELYRTEFQDLDVAIPQNISENNEIDLQFISQKNIILGEYERSSIFMKGNQFHISNKITKTGDRAEFTLLKNDENLDFCLGIMNLDIFKMILIDPEAEFFLQNSYSICSNGLIINNNQIQENCEFQGQLNKQIGKTYIFKFTDDYQLKISSNHNSFSGKFLLNPELNYIFFVKTQKNVKIQLTSFSQQGNKQRPSILEKILGADVQYDLQILTSNTQNALQSKFKQYIMNNGTFVTAYSDMLLKIGDKWQLGILDQIDDTQGWICFGIIDVTLAPLVLNMKNVRQWLQSKSIGICTDGRYFNNAFKNGYRTIIESKDQFQPGSLVELNFISDISFKISTLDGRYSSIFQIDQDRKYIPFYELSPNQQFLMISEDLISRQVDGEEQYKEIMEDFKDIQWKFQNNLPNMQYSFKNKGLKCQQEQCQAYISVVLEQNDEWEIIISDDQQDNGEICFGVILSVFNPVLQQTNTVTLNQANVYCISQKIFYNFGYNVQFSGQSDSSFGTIFNLKIQNNKFEIRSIDHSFFGILELNPDLEYSPYVYLSEQRRVLLSRVKSKYEFEYLCYYYFLIYIFILMNLMDSYSGLKEQIFPWKIQSNSDNLEIEKNYIFTQENDGLAYIKYDLQNLDEWTVIITQAQLSQVCFGIVEKQFIEKFQKNSNPEVYGIIKNLMIGQCPTNGEVRSLNGYDQFGSQQSNGINVPYKFTFYENQLRSTSLFGNQFQVHYTLQEDKTYVPFFALFNGRAGLIINDVKIAGQDEQEIQQDILESVLQEEEDLHSEETQDNDNEGQESNDNESQISQTDNQITEQSLDESDEQEQDHHQNIQTNNNIKKSNSIDVCIENENIRYIMEQQCVMFFPYCCFEGQSQEICDGYQSIEFELNKEDIGSIFIPKGESILINFGGKSENISIQQCINGVYINEQ